MLLCFGNNSFFFVLFIERVVENTENTRVLSRRVGINRKCVQGSYAESPVRPDVTALHCGTRVQRDPGGKCEDQLPASWRRSPADRKEGDE